MHPERVQILSTKSSQKSKQVYRNLNGPFGWQQRLSTAEYLIHRPRVSHFKSIKEIHSMKIGFWWRPSWLHTFNKNTNSSCLWPPSLSPAQLDDSPQHFSLICSLCGLNPFIVWFETKTKFADFPKCAHRGHARTCWLIFIVSHECLSNFLIKLCIGRRPASKLRKYSFSNFV